MHCTYTGYIPVIYRLYTKNGEKKIFELRGWEIGKLGVGGREYGVWRRVGVSKWRHGRVFLAVQVFGPSVCKQGVVEQSAFWLWPKRLMPGMRAPLRKSAALVLYRYID